MIDCQSTLILPRLECSLSVGWEKPVANATLSAYGLQAYQDRAGTIRVFKAGVVGMTIAKEGRKGWTIQHVFTAPEHRRKGMARQLLAACRLAFGQIRHGSNLSPDGVAWANSVG